MPELPDVEHFRRVFRRHGAGRTVRSVRADRTIVRNATPQSLGRALARRRFVDPDRHGKWLVCWTDGPALLLHFGMTGDLVWSGDDPERHRHDRLLIGFAGGGELRYRNMRKLGGVWLAHDVGELRGILGPLGPDALVVTREEFLGLLERKRGGIKAALMDQTFLAGLGNILVDEVLWQARIHPRRRVESLGRRERAGLYRTMERILRESVERFDYVPRKRTWLSHVRGRAGAACPRCGTPLDRSVVAGRTTYTCPRCQPPRSERVEGPGAGPG